jgi:hypothetical protein
VIDREHVRASLPYDSRSSTAADGATVTLDVGSEYLYECNGRVVAAYRKALPDDLGPSFWIVLLYQERNAVTAEAPYRVWQPNTHLPARPFGVPTIVAIGGSARAPCMPRE